MRSPARTPPRTTRAWVAAAVLACVACGGKGSGASEPAPAAGAEAQPVSALASEAQSAKKSAKKDTALGWASVDEDGRREIAAFAKGYLAYVQAARTTRQSTEALKSLAKSAGAVPWTSDAQPKPGELLLWSDATHGTLGLLRVGTAPVGDGLTILQAGHDAAIIRLTPAPIYERSGLALFDTSILGTLDLESWLHTPLALSIYRAPVTAKDTALTVILGDEPGEPVFTIPDLLPHLSRKVQRKKLIDSPERLDAVAGFTAEALRNVLRRAGVAKGDLSFVEATLVPAGAATYVGGDKALIAGANHARRAAAYAAVHALLEETSPQKSTLLILSGSSGQSYAAPGPDAQVANLSAKAIETLAPKTDALALRRSLANSAVLMFDHSKGDRNRGVVLGRRRDDSSPTALRRVLSLFEAGEVATQVRQTSGWSQAREVASLDIDTVALGIPVSGVGRPYELLSTFDLFQARKACGAWVSQ